MQEDNNKPGLENEELKDLDESQKEVIELLPPNNTVYINNLNEKIQIDG